MIHIRSLDNDHFLAKPNRSRLSHRADNPALNPRFFRRQLLHLGRQQREPVNTHMRRKHPLAPYHRHIYLLERFAGDVIRRENRKAITLSAHGHGHRLVCV